MTTLDPFEELESRGLLIGIESGNHVRIEVLEVMPESMPGAGDVRLSVSVSADGFLSPARPCWVLRSMFKDFLQALRALEATRQGQATLESPPSGGFLITLTAPRPSQSLIVTGTVSGAFLPAATSDRNQLAFAFELDSSLLLQLRDDFQRLVPT